jgi:hypothetical protein
VDLHVHQLERHVHGYQLNSNLATFVAALALGLIGAATAAAAPRVTEAPSFLLVERAGGVAAAACAPPQAANQIVSDFVSQQLRDSGLDPQLVVVLLSRSVGCDRLWYHAVANDVRGIGYAHQEEAELFDHSPDSRLEGIAFLNDLSFARENQAEFSRELNHELGHRWGSRVHIAAPPLDEGALLGREQQHWSYFLDTGGSPLEGNAFATAEPGSITADTQPTTLEFSKLDLYLMGVLEPELVGPFTLYQPNENVPDDCVGSPASASSPPQTCGGVALPARAHSLDVWNVIAAEGPRSPAAETRRRSIDVAFLVVESGNSPATASDCEAFSAAIDQSSEAFTTATGELITLNNVTRTSQSCATWSAGEPARDAASCALPVPGALGASSALRNVAAALTALLIVRRRPSRERRRSSLARALTTE